MKTCKWCNEQKELTEFYKAPTSKDGVQSHCKVCHNAAGKNRYYANHEQERLRLSKYYLDNYEQEKQARRNHYKENKSVYLFNFYKREERLRLATPDWLTEEMLIEIKSLYKQREQISKDTGIAYHVDHIIPIQGENVCGLHVPWNLQIITAEENLRKSNKHE